MAIRKFAFGVILAISGICTAVVAQDKTADAPLDDIREKIKTHLGDFEITSLQESAVPGLYELVSGGTIFYVDASGQYLIEGDMIDLETRVSLTEQKLGKLHIGMIASMDEASMLVYEPEKSTGRSITVCGAAPTLSKQ